MILRKPYALFIKLFKVIHIIASVCIAFLIFKTSDILKFLSNYIYTENSVVGKSIVKNYVNVILFIVPVVLMIISLLIFGVMYRKNKPKRFYLISFFSYLVVLVTNIYVVSFLKTMEFNVVSVSVAKLIHDFIFMSVILEIITFIMFFLRGLGLDFRKFDFNSDLLKIDISDEDREEIEVTINVDTDESRRKQKEKIRRFRYFFYEHKFIVITLSIIFIVLVVLLTYYFNNINGKTNRENKYYNNGNISIRVNRSYILNTDYRNNKVSDNYLVIVDFTSKSNLGKTLYLNDFNLNIGEAYFKPVSNYYNYFLDIGKGFFDTKLSNDDNRSILIFEISEKYKDDDMILNYLDLPIRLSPSNTRGKKVINKALGNEMSFNDTLGNLSFNIADCNIQDKVLINYEYCYRDECVNSIEYLVPTINENYDKAVLELNLKYTNNSEYNFKDFYEFFTEFGSIEYVVNNKTYYQYSGFERIESKKVKSNSMYMGIDKNIMNSSNIKLIFNIQGIKYEYVIR